MAGSFATVQNIAPTGTSRTVGDSRSGFSGGDILFQLGTILLADKLKDKRARELQQERIAGEMGIHELDNVARAAVEQARILGERGTQQENIAGQMAIHTASDTARSADIEKQIAAQLRGYEIAGGIPHAQALAINDQYNKNIASGKSIAEADAIRTQSFKQAQLGLGGEVGLALLGSAPFWSLIQNWAKKDAVQPEAQQKLVTDLIQDLQTKFSGNAPKPVDITSTNAGNLSLSSPALPEDALAEYNKTIGALKQPSPAAVATPPSTSIVDEAIAMSKALPPEEGFDFLNRVGLALSSPRGIAAEKSHPVIEWWRRITRPASDKQETKNNTVTKQLSGTLVPMPKDSPMTVDTAQFGIGQMGNIIENLTAGKNVPPEVLRRAIQEGESLDKLDEYIHFGKEISSFGLDGTPNTGSSYLQFITTNPALAKFMKHNPALLSFLRSRGDQSVSAQELISQIPDDKKQSFLLGQQHGAIRRMIYGNE